MSVYQITSFAGIDLGTFEATSPRAALNMLAIEAGYADHASVNPSGSTDPRHLDWTSSPAAFRRGDYALLVAEQYETADLG